MILDDIVAAKKGELAETKRRVSLSELQGMASGQTPALDFAAPLKGDRMRLIAEIKKASPSAGIIRADFDPVAIAMLYAGYGASAISILTETTFFQGSLEDFGSVRNAVGRRLPLLRKDFIFDPYQVYEARAWGADSLLLIAAILSPQGLAELVTLSRELGMEPLVEVHRATEIDVALKAESRIIGINNRDLSTFRTDLSTSARLRPLIPCDKIVVSESGIKNRRDVASLWGHGIDAILVGEAIMASADIAASLKELLG